MAVFLILIGALLFIAGMMFGLISVFMASKFQYFLFQEQNGIFRRIAGPDDGNGHEDKNEIRSRNLWNYIKSEDDNGIAEISRYKNKIKKSFLLFSISCFVGLASILTAIILMLFS